MLRALWGACVGSHIPSFAASGSETGDPSASHKQPAAPRLNQGEGPAEQEEDTAARQVCATKQQWQVTMTEATAGGLNQAALRHNLCWCCWELPSGLLPALQPTGCKGVCVCAAGIPQGVCHFWHLLWTVGSCGGGGGGCNAGRPYAVAWWAGATSRLSAAGTLTPRRAQRGPVSTQQGRGGRLVYVARVTRVGTFVVVCSSAPCPLPGVHHVQEPCPPGALVVCAHTCLPLGLHSLSDPGKSGAWHAAARRVPRACSACLLLPLPVARCEEASLGCS